MSLRADFRAHLAATQILSPGETLVVGYSGGADSTALVQLLHECEVDLIAAHLNHGQRPEADCELGLCEAFCQERGIPFISGRADVPKLAQSHRLGLEEAGRRARYEFFRQAMRQTGAGRIATAHTRDDHLETILFHAVRGTGLSGLAGIPERTDDLVRPLLPFSRAQTRAFCGAEGLWFHDDPANFDVNFSRVRLRERVLPELRLVHPGADESLVRLAEIAGEEDRFLDSAAANALSVAETPLNGKLNFLTLDCECAFDREALRHLPPVLRKRAIRLAASFLGAALPFDAVRQLSERLVENDGSGALTAPEGEVVLEWDTHSLHVRRLELEEPFRFPVTVPGETLAESFGWTIAAVESQATQASPRDALTIEVRNLQGNLYFRSAADGDRIEPVGFNHSRKISDLLGEAKLTLAARKRLPIICDMLGPVWIPGVAYAARVQAEPNERVLSLAFRPLNETESVR